MINSIYIYVCIYIYSFILQIGTLGHHAGSISPYGDISSKGARLAPKHRVIPSSEPTVPPSFTKASKTSGVPAVFVHINIHTRVYIYIHIFILMYINTHTYI